MGGGFSRLVFNISSLLSLILLLRSVCFLRKSPKLDRTGLTKFEFRYSVISICWLIYIFFFQKVVIFGFGNLNFWFYPDGGFYWRGQRLILADLRVHYCIKAIWLSAFCDWLQCRTMVTMVEVEVEEEDRVLERIRMGREGTMSTIWSYQLLPTIQIQGGRTARTHPMSSVLDYWICIPLILSSFLTWVSFPFIKARIVMLANKDCGFCFRVLRVICVNVLCAHDCIIGFSRCNCVHEMFPLWTLCLSV